MALGTASNEDIFTALNALPGPPMASPASMAVYMSRNGIRRPSSPLPADLDGIILRMVGEGHGYTAIGRSVGLSRTAIRDRAKRLGVRPVTVAPPMPLPTVTMPEYRRVDGGRVMPISTRRTAIEGPTLGQGWRPPSSAPIAPPRCCQWPFGEPRTPEFRMCEARPVVPGRPYCAAHVAVAYVARPETVARAA